MLSSAGEGRKAPEKRSEFTVSGAKIKQTKIKERRRRTARSLLTRDASPTTPVVLAREVTAPVEIGGLVEVCSTSRDVEIECLPTLMIDASLE